MKRPVLLCALLLGFLIHSTAVAGTWEALRSQRPEKTSVEVLSSDLYRTTLRLQLQGFYMHAVDGALPGAVTITSPGAVPIQKAGAPDLPQFSVSLAIPDLGGMRLSVTQASFREYSTVELAPSKGNLMRSVQPADVPYRYSEVYAQAGFWPSETAITRDPYILRDYRGQAVLIRPFQYDPVAKTLRVYTDITVEFVHDEGLPAVNPMVRQHAVSGVDPQFATLYSRHFGNAPSLTYAPLAESGKMLIICPQAWMSAMQPFIDWKLRCGIPVEMVDVLQAGGTASAIQSFVASKYQSEGLTYLLLVGDAAQLPSLSAQGGASDPSFGYVLGNDSYAEVMVGRFSAESLADVETQVQRVLNYEIHPDTVAGWYKNGVVIASNQGPGDDNEMDWEHAVNMRSDLLNFTYGDVAELYDGTNAATNDAPGDPGNVDLANLLQAGVGAITYTGHGGPDVFSTTGFSSADVQNLTNTNRLPFIWAVACVNGQFDTPGAPCLGESFLRANVNGQPTGAIATFMSSINQSWNPPMDGQDEMVDILVQSYAGNTKYTFGGLSVNGCLQMNDDYGQAGYEMTDTWHIFGDPSLHVRTAVPQAMSVNHVSVLPVGLSTLAVNASFNGATVVLTMNGQIIATGTVSNGFVSLAFPPLSMPDTLFVTVTGFNQVPYLGQVLVIPASGPYVIHQQNTLVEVSGNNDGLADYGEIIDVNLDLLNVGLADANGVGISISTTDPYVSLISSSVLAGTIPSNASIQLPAAFRYQVANNVPDQHVVYFTLTATDGNGTSWTSGFTQVMQAPVLEGGLLTLDDTQGGDGDGYLEPGENASITIRCHNNGHSDALTANAVVTSLCGFLNLSAGNFPISLPEQQFADITFTAGILNNIALGSVYDLALNLSSGAYAGYGYYTGNAGIILEDFETNDFSSYSWTGGGTLPWITTTLAPFDGVYCATNSDINDNESSELLLSLTALLDDSVSFWYKLSSEQDWDYLRFYIDGTELGAWSGLGSWTYASFPLTAGTHTLKFLYEKDNIISAGLDCAFLDNIRFPFGTQVTGISTSVHAGADVQVWPNPSNGQFQVKTSLLNGQWLLRDVSGRTVLSGSTRGSENFIVDGNRMQAGLYLLEIFNAQKRETVKVHIR